MEHYLEYRNKQDNFFCNKAWGLGDNKWNDNKAWGLGCTARNNYNKWNE
uniref:Uncharacterized protein n=1 Tax=Arundo donax TaxID=35708 RepID=A0A0A9E4H2_ARUDO